MTKEDQTAAIKLVEDKITALTESYLFWWMEDIQEHQRPRTTVLREAQEFAQKKFESMSLGEQDAYSCQVDSWLPVVNSFIPSLQKFYDEMRALVGRIYSIEGLRGDPYKDQVTGDPRITSINENLQLTERLSTSISKQSGSISARNYRIGQEMKLGIYTGNVQNLGGDRVPKDASASLRHM